jgi:hypothetical protein
VEVEKLSQAMTEIHTQVAEIETRERMAAVQEHKDKTHVRSPNFQVGDYVLVAKHRKGRLVQLAGELERPAPRRECGVQLRVSRFESANEGAQGCVRNAPIILS